MSKIGRKPIETGKVKVEIKGQEIHYTGPKASGIYVLPAELHAQLNDHKLMLLANNNDQKQTRNINRVWGLHRALLANKISGAAEDFEKQIEIVGLGFKAALSG